MNYANQWIKLSDELPPFDTPVFFTTRDHVCVGSITSDHDGHWLFAEELEVPFFHEGEWVGYDAEIVPWDDFKPTHWLPFPEPRRVDG